MCHTTTMLSRKTGKLFKLTPIMCLLDTTRRKKDEGGAKSGVRHLERMKHGNGIKSREDKSNGIEILITEAFASVVH